jgi:hypothetical protein
LVSCIGSIGMAMHLPPRARLESSRQAYPDLEEVV